MAEEVFDLLIIGGGIFGCGIARDATLRGLSVALVEKNDFCSGTTVASSRLIHGGLRYLAMGDFGLVREGLGEQAILLRLVHHRIQRLTFLVPLYRNEPIAWRLGIPVGVWLYRLLSSDAQMPIPGKWTMQEIIQSEPMLRTDGLLSAWCYLDAQEPFPERLCIDNLLDAAAHGACIANYVKVTNLLVDGNRVIGAAVRDTLTGETMEVRAQWVVNATGAWADTIVAMARPNAPKRVRRTKGIHLVVPKFTENAFVFRAKSDGRIFFVLPWNGFSLIGTTDTDCDENIDALTVSDAEVNYLVSETRRYFPEASLETIHHTFVGVRSLVRKDNKMPSSVTRRHLIFDHAKDGLHGLLSVIGGKMTTYRQIAKEVVDAVCQRLGKQAPCTTHHRPFVDDPIALLRNVKVLASPLGWDEATVQRLVMLYGHGSEDIVRRALDRKGEQPCVPANELPPSFYAEVKHVFEAEMACTTDDVVLRRTMLGFHPELRQAAVRAIRELPTNHGGRRTA